MSAYDHEMLSLLGDLELFPECSIPSYKDEAFFQDLPLGKDLSGHPDSGLADEEFPSWLDLKMDLSLLEGLEAPDLVLDDLFLGDVTNGQSPDILPAPQCGDKAPLATQQLSHERNKETFVDIISPPLTPTDGPVVEVVSPPSSPDWRVPDMGLPSSPVSVFSPAPASPSFLSAPASPGYSILSAPESPGYSLISAAGPSSPECTYITSAPGMETVLTFVAPIVQPVTVIEAAPGQALNLDSLLGLSFVIDNSPPEAQSEESAPPSPVMAKKERKRKTPYSRSSKSRAKSSADDEEYVAVPTNKKERKRMQNKDAATRYRIKKRMESGSLADQEQELEEENKKLRQKALQLANEMGYLKTLMREMFKARGLL